MRIFSKKSSEKISSKFEEAGIPPEDAQAYLSGSLVLSLAFALAMSAVVFLFLHTDLFDSLASLFLSFSLVLALFILFPSALAWRKRQQIESELPFLLREFAIYLDIGMPFEKCVAKISSRNYSLSSEFSRAWKEMKSGSTCQSALSAISLRTGSMHIKRCMLLLSSIYESGTGAEPLKRTAEELSHAQLSSQRSQSSRLSVLAIAFIAASALAPSFFSVYASVSPVISDSQLPEWQIWAAFLFAFPLLNLLVLGAMSFLFPSAPSASSGNAELLEEFLAKHNFPFGKRAFMLLLAAISLASAAVFFLFSQPLLALFSLCIAPAIYSLASYFSGREISEAESRLPDALYSAASVHRLLSPEKMLSILAKGGFGRLSESFALALRRQKAGEGFAASLQAAAAHCPSPLVERAFSLLVVAYETGANMYFALREAAEDVVSFFSLVRERSALLSLQRYTILASSAFLVPIILGTVLSIVPSLSSAASSISASQDNSLLSSLSLACQIYLVINAALSSAMLSLAETNAKKAVLYFSFLAPVSQVLFSLAVAGALPLA